MATKQTVAAWSCLILSSIALYERDWVFTAFYTFLAIINFYLDWKNG